MEPVPEQDVRFGDPASSPTPWADVQHVLETAELFWISTVRREGQPHVTPLPAVWADDCLHFCTGPGEQKAVNVAANPQVVLTTGETCLGRGHDPAHLQAIETAVALIARQDASHFQSPKHGSMPVGIDPTQAMRQRGTLAVDPAVGDDVAVDDDHARPVPR